MPSDSVPLLLIEDNPADMRLLVELIEEAAPGRFRIEPARSLSEGLEALRAREFAAVILDLSLPDADGALSIAVIHGEAPTVPVIVLTGMLDDEVRCAVEAHGAAAAFVKGEQSVGALIAALDGLLGNGG